MRAVIFAGPSLPPGARPGRETEIDWRPPARQGDVYRAALARPAAIGIIDGYFEVTPTVWHKEILWAMAEGIHIFGSASIGALRAAELDVFGMKGIGRVYEDFRGGVLEDDDEVAVLHGPEELGYPPLTEAMVNLRATFAAAARDGILAPAATSQLTDIAKQLFYKKRTFAAVMRAAADARLPKAVAREFTKWLPAGRVDQKRLDALAMLASLQIHLAAGVPPLTVTYEFADTAAWRPRSGG